MAHLRTVCNVYVTEQERGDLSQRIPDEVVSHPALALACDFGLRPVCMERVAYMDSRRRAVDSSLVALKYIRLLMADTKKKEKQLGVQSTLSFRPD
jgi:hypothetical protein